MNSCRETSTLLPRYAAKLCPRLVGIVFLSLIATAIAEAQAPSVLVDKDALDPDKLIYLSQNWSDRERQWFYHVDQGSQLIPYELFLNLEQADNPSLFRDPGNMLRYGLLPSFNRSGNPDGLPVGFSRNGDYLGLTCAACHTQQLKYNGRFIRIDGGQPMFDLQLFLHDLESALKDTLQDADKLKRFAARQQDSAPDGQQLESARQYIDREHRLLEDHNRRNHTDVAYGFARLDAFGAILNKGLYLTGVEDNFNPPSAPTSYPYLWDTPHHDYVEWNGSQSNNGVGALARNVGEVIGVFGAVDVTPVKRLFFFDGGYPSSIQARNLRKLEKTISRMHSPRWPELFPAIDRAQARTGRRLYERYCLSCHHDIDRIDPARKVQARMSSLEKIGTDPLMVRNAIEYTGRTGIFEGQPRFYKGGEIMGTVAPALYVVNNIMVGVLQNNVLQVLLARRDARKLGHSEDYLPKYLDGKPVEEGMESSEKALLAYKARPLNGIWTGAPYLHNGSVPNLYQLLLPAEERDKTFYIGSWEFDPVNVGYVTGEAPGAFLFDTTLPGNSNAGHEYGTGYDGLPPLTEADIRALVEYMKTL